MACPKVKEIQYKLTDSWDFCERIPLGDRLNAQLKKCTSRSKQWHVEYKFQVHLNISADQKFRGFNIFRKIYNT